MTQNRFTIPPSSTIALQASFAGSLRGFCTRWRLRRQCEARARELETVIREMHSRLARDIGFELMACRRGDDGAANGHALIQAASIAFAEKPSDNG